MCVVRTLYDTMCDIMWAQISAANALKALMEDKLKKANAALVATFQGEGSSALQELRSYRVPPKITFHVLQVRLGGLGCGGVE